MATNSRLNILEPDMFEDDQFEHAHHIQANFYKGAPPQWVNFHLSEKNDLPFVKRHGYEDIKRLIKANSRKKRVLSVVKLIHEPGSGASTLAMQVLWDLRNEFRCAKLKDAVTEQNAIVNDVFKLTEQQTRQNRRKPVLLLLDNADSHRDNLTKQIKSSLIDKLSNNRYNVPVIILNCVRKTQFAEETSGNTVTLRAKLRCHNNREERDEFHAHREEVIKQFRGHKSETFHGLHIIAGDFSPKYTAETCDAIVPPKIRHRPRRDQLFAILTLISKFAPGSNLLLDPCIEFLRSNDTALSFEEQMGHFSKLLVRYTCFEKGVEYVSIAHPHIATQCVATFTYYGVRMSAVTSLFLEYFCRTDEESPHLMQVAKTMLTMREMYGKIKEKEKFSKLIDHINKEEEPEMCIKLLTFACRVFGERPTFPQALARYLYLTVDKNQPISEVDYKKAEKYAREAIRRHPASSFIMNTLGQVHKHHLIHLVRQEEYTVHDVLHLGCLALKAFQEEEVAAEREEADGNEDDRMTNIASIFNSWGKLAYLEVASQLFDGLVKINQDWKGVLTCSTQISECLDLQVNRKTRCVVRNLQSEVQNRFEFFEKYLTYSRNPGREDPADIRDRANRCYTKYVGMPPKVLKMAFKEAGETSEPERDITTMADLQQFFERHSSEHSPEFFHQRILLQNGWDQDLSAVVPKMERAYQHTYEQYLRSRHLVPLYVKSRNGWQTLSELSLQPWQVEKGAHDAADGIEEGAVSDRENVATRLQNLERIQGIMQRPHVFAVLNNDNIAVQLYNREVFCSDGPISFYLGFTIKGPVAFDVRKTPGQISLTSSASGAP